MNHVNRRAFLRKLAGGVAYTAPVVYSMVAPIDLVAQGMGKSSGKGQGKDTSKGTSGMTEFVPPPGGAPPGAVGS